MIGLQVTTTPLNLIEIKLFQVCIALSYHLYYGFPLDKKVQLHIHSQDENSTEGRWKQKEFHSNPHPLYNCKLTSLIDAIF
ncbi:hypothetical protein GDO86_002974 [Hymenochirus boettgeri]|uniref:Uncharacterized protein n=1 Tax=Hymenochirus boettgeri TaxID=247094 RepID=A0A8T2K567_9PIPI|nr:hypothetical protein GDO86_002974 [Hymenochirus boettgeri]